MSAVSGSASTGFVPPMSPRSAPKFTPGGKEILKSGVTLSLGGANPLSWNFQMLGLNTQKSGLEHQTFILGDDRTVRAGKFPVPLKIVEMQKKYMDDALKCIVKEIQDIEAFLKNSVVNGPSANPRIKQLLNLIMQQCNIEYEQCEKDVKDKLDCLASLKEELTAFQKDLLVPALSAATKQLINENIVSLTASIADVQKQIAEALEKLNAKSKEKQECIDCMGKGPFPAYMRKNLEGILKQLIGQRANLEARTSASNGVKTSISLAEWLKQIDFFKELNVINPPDLAEVPAFSAVSLHPRSPGSNAISLIPALESVSGDDVLFRLVFDDAGNQLGAQSSDCWNLSARDSELIQLFPDPIGSITPKGLWRNIQLKVVSDAALKSLQNKNPAVVQEAMTNSFNILFLKFKKYSGGSYKVGEYLTSEYYERTGVTAGYRYKPDLKEWHIPYGRLTYVENSALILKVTGIAHTFFPPGDAMERLLDEVVDESDKLLTTYV